VARRGGRPRRLRPTPEVGRFDNSTCQISNGRGRASRRCRGTLTTASRLSVPGSTRGGKRLGGGRITSSLRRRAHLPTRPATLPAEFSRVQPFRRCRYKTRRC
jgi:hypothetical protein